MSRLDFETTIEDVNQVMKPLWGWVAMYDWLILFYLVFGMILTAIAGVLLGIFVHYGISIGLACIYLFVFAIIVYCVKRWTGKLIKNSHFCLSLILHAENNWHYMKHGVIFWPGFMAKWIEIIFIPKTRP